MDLNYGTAQSVTLDLGNHIQELSFSKFVLMIDNNFLDDRVNTFTLQRSSFVSKVGLVYKLPSGLYLLRSLDIYYMRMIYVKLLTAEVTASTKRCYGGTHCENGLAQLIESYTCI